MIKFTSEIMMIKESINILTLKLLFLTFEVITKEKVNKVLISILKKLGLLETTVPRKFFDKIYIGNHCRD